MSSVTSKVAKGELVFTSFLLAISVVVLWDAFTLTEVGLNVIVGPKAFALAIGFVMLFLTSLQLILVARGDKGEPDGIEGGEYISKSNWKGLLLVIGGMAFHIFTLELIGFILATIPLFVAITIALGDKRWIRALVVGTLLSLAIFFGFTKGLQLELPVGFEFLEPPAPTIVDDNGEVVVVEDEEESW